MSHSEIEVAPVRDHKHRALNVFLGEWRAEGQSYGSSHQPVEDPRSAAELWVSAHTGQWHTGEYFLIQDERAVIGGKPFDTLSVMGVDANTGHHFARTFENHGFYRHYDVLVDRRVWTITGERERAQIEFSEDGRTQTIAWEWRPKDRWLPLCDRIARRQD
ncbi:hypothetical protein [Gemmatimonas sp.]|uniref:hypothetical protein n=1 Tax=Gemmatimonas sp. TaxID=1962908 RepID=UPI00286DB745|nr:hypothetical protein [Gemmatimonas sp.]